MCVYSRLVLDATLEILIYSKGWNIHVCVCIVD